MLIELSKSILSHLGVEDDDFTLSNFLLSLYEQSKESDEVSIRSKRFEEVVRQNGGDEFPRQLIDEAFKIMDEKMGPVKTKREKDQDQCIPLVKKEEIEFKGLVIPNVKPKIEEEDYEVQEHKIMPSQFKREEYVDDKTKIQQIEILVGDVVRGVVSNLAPYGAFIKFSNGQSGLCHVSKISNSRVEHPQDILKINQEVFVKVEKIESVNNNTGGRYRQRDKISLSMRDVDQVTGMQIEREERGRSKRLYEESSGVDGDRVAAPKED